MTRNRLALSGEWLIRKRWFVLAVWGVLLGAGFYLAPRVDAILQGGTQIPGCQSEEVREILRRNFGNRFGHEMVFIFYSKTHRAEESRFREAVAEIQLALRKASRVNTIMTYYDTGSLELKSKDGHSVLGLAELDVPDSFAAQQATPRVRAVIQRCVIPEWMSVYVTGQGATYFDIIQASERDALRAEARSFPVIALILIVTFGALLASGIPIVLGVAAVSITLGLVYLAGIRWPMFILAKNAVTMIGLGVGIDYSLFMVSRFREELKSGLNTREAVVALLPTAGKTVVFSAITVMIGLTSILILNLPFLNSMTAAAIAVVLVAAGGALTLLPALLYWLGPAINWPRPLADLIDRSKRGRIWQRVATRVMQYPVRFFLGTLLLLLALAIPLCQLKTNTLTVMGLPRGVESRQGFERLQTDFAAGLTGPLEIIVETGAGRKLASAGTIARLYRLSRLLAADARVVKVESIVDIDPSLTLADYRKLYVAGGGMLGAANLFSQMVQAYVGGSARTRDGERQQTLLRVITAAEPGSETARDLVGQIRNEWGPRIFNGPGYRVLVGGSSALQLDLDRTLMAKLPWMIGIVCGATFLVLVILFRSVLIPLKSIFMNILSVLASFGLLTLVFQNGTVAHFLGLQYSGGISSIILVMLFAVLFGLSMDYEIFLTLRIKEEHDRGFNNEASVARGLEKTGALVTSAALIMVVVFGAFAFTRMLMTQEFGLGLAAAVFLDATVIRVLLMPATMRLLGEWNWWLPRSLERILPRGEQPS